MSAALSAASSSVVVLDAAAEELDTATSPYFDDGGAAAFRWPVAEQTKSTLAGQGKLRILCNNNGVPKDYKPFFAHDKTACTPPPEGSNTICVYADALDAGMRPPLHDFHGALLWHYGLTPSQLAPNAWRYMAAFVLLCTDAGVDPMISVFQHFFSICAHKGDAVGWHHFKPHLCRRRLFTGKMTRYPGWKSRFFFLQSPPTMPWPCAIRWGKPSRAAVSKTPVTTATITAIEKLLDRAGNTEIDIMLFLSRRSLPVGCQQIPLTPQLAAVKEEAAAASGGTEQTRKRKSPESVTPPPPPSDGTATPTPVGPSTSESSVMRRLSQLAQMAEAELDGKERELQELRAARDEHAAAVAGLGDELLAAKDAHAAEVVVLKEELQKANTAHAAEVGRLAEELQKEKAEYAAEVRAVKVQCQRELMTLQHQSVIMQNERYVMGLRDMRKLAVTMYKDVIDPSELNHELLSNFDDLAGCAPQAPAEDH